MLGPQLDAGACITRARLTPHIAWWRPPHLLGLSQVAVAGKQDLAGPVFRHLGEGALQGLHAPPGCSVPLALSLLNSEDTVTARAWSLQACKGWPCIS